MPSSFNVNYLDILRPTFLKQIKIIAVIQLPITNLFDSFYIECQKVPIFDFKFVVIPSEQPGKGRKVSVDEICEYLSNKGYPFELGYDENKNIYVDLADFNPDIVFFQTPYDEQRISHIYSSEYVKNFAKVACISYGAIMVEHVGIYENLISKNPFYDNAWRIFVENDEQVSSYAHNIKSKIIPIGYIKLDTFLNYGHERDNSDNHWSLPKGSAFRIAWKPRWIGKPEYSNLFKYLSFFLNLIPSRQDIDFVWDMHPLMKSQIINEGLMTQKELNNIFRQIKQISNFRILEGGDFLECIWSADLFIADASSTLVEYSLTGKPIIYTPTEDKPNSFGRKILKGAYVVENEQQMIKTIDKLKNNDDPLRQVRELNKQFISKKHPLGKSIAQALLNYLKQEFSSHWNCFSNKSNVFICCLICELLVLQVSPSPLCLDLRSL